MNSETILWIVVVVGVIWKLVSYGRAQLNRPPDVPKDEPIPVHTVHVPETPARPGVYVHPYVSAPVYTPPRAHVRHSAPAAPKTNSYGELED